jgi:hypothetical protein
MGKCYEYRANAADCMKLAAAANDRTTRLVFLSMAGAWLRLADRLADRVGLGKSYQIDDKISRDSLSEMSAGRECHPDCDH